MKVKPPSLDVWTVGVLLDDKKEIKKYNGIINN